MPDDVSSVSREIPVARLMLGQRMRFLREDAGITPEEAGRAIDVPASRIRRLEDGRYLLDAPELRILLRLYETDTELADSVLQLADSQNPNGQWWLSYEDSLPGWVEPYFFLEAQANVIYSYETQFVPGLLQTDAYMRRVIAMGSAPDKTKARRAEARMLRQDLLLRREPPRVFTVLDETLLRRPPVEADDMRDQIRHLIKMSEHPAMTIRVLPLGPPVLMNAFAILRFAPGGPRDLVYVEHLTSAAYLDGDDLEEYAAEMQKILGLALSEEKTREMLQGILETL